MEHIAQGKRSDTLGFPHSRVSAPCKGKSFNPLCCYSCLIADLAVLKWSTVCIFCSILAPCLKAFALTGRNCSNTRYPGCRFACPGLCAPLGFQPVLAKSETSISNIRSATSRACSTCCASFDIIYLIFRILIRFCPRFITAPIAAI